MKKDELCSKYENSNSTEHEVDKESKPEPDDVVLQLTVSVLYLTQQKLGQCET